MQRTPQPEAYALGQTLYFFLASALTREYNALFLGLGLPFAFGISNLAAEEIKKQAYNAFEPTLRVTDKAESNGYKNDGVLMVKIDSEDKYRQYANVQNYQAKRSAKPLQIGSWYQVWFVVNNIDEQAVGIAAAIAVCTIID